MKICIHEENIIFDYVRLDWAVCWSEANNILSKLTCFQYKFVNLSPTSSYAQLSTSGATLPSKLGTRRNVWKMQEKSNIKQSFGHFKVFIWNLNKSRELKRFIYTKHLIYLNLIAELVVKKHDLMSHPKRNIFCSV